MNYAVCVSERNTKRVKVGWYTVLLTRGLISRGFVSDDGPSSTPFEMLPCLLEKLRVRRSNLNMPYKQRQIVSLINRLPVQCRSRGHGVFASSKQANLLRRADKFPDAQPQASGY